MKKKIDGLRALDAGNLVYLPVEYDEEDHLICHTPKGDVQVGPFGEDAELQELLRRLGALGLEAHGCFDCVYFTRSGMQVEAGGGLGYCIEGKVGAE
jgi:hypothetical protein